MAAVPKQVEAYLNSLDIPDNGTDFTTCQWAVLAASVARRSGRMPIPFGPRALPWEHARPEKPKRQVVNTGPPPAPKQTAFVLTDRTNTQLPFTIPLPRDDRQQAPIDPGPGSEPPPGVEPLPGIEPPPGGSPPGSEPPGSPGQAPPGGGDQRQPQQQQNGDVAGNIVGAIFGAVGNDQGGNNPGSGDQGNGNPGQGNGNPGSGNPNPGPGGSGNLPGANGQPGSQGGGGNQNDNGNGNGNNAPGSGSPGQGNGNVPGGGSGNGQNPAVGGNNPGGPQVIDIGGSQVTVAPGPNGGVVIGTQTFGVGQVGTINGQQVSIFLGGNVAVGTGGAGGQTINVGSGANLPPSLTIGNNVITAGPGGVFTVAPGVTLAPGGSAVTIGGTTYSLAAGGTVAVVNGATQTLAGAPANPTNNPALLTINGQTITAAVSAGSTAFVIAPGTTLTPGGSVVVSGTTYALPSTGSQIVVNGVTSTLGSPRITAAPVLTINGFTFNPTISNGRTYYSIASGVTLSPGGVITVSGTRISLQSDGKSLIFGSSASAILPASNNATTTRSSSTTRGVGDAVASGISASRRNGADSVRAAGMTLEGFVLGLMGMILAWI